MLNGTMCATERALCCLVENYQTPDVCPPFILRGVDTNTAFTFRVSLYLRYSGHICRDGTSYHGLKSCQRTCRESKSRCLVFVLVKYVIHSHAYAVSSGIRHMHYSGLRYVNVLSKYCCCVNIAAWIELQALHVQDLITEHISTKRLFQ